MSGAERVRRSVARSALVFAVSKWILLMFCRVWHRLRIENRERVPANGPVLLVANHTSYLDPPLTGIGLKRPVAFLAKSGLAVFAPMRWWMRQVGVTLIDRAAPSKEALRLVAEALAAGEVIGLFPEGTRSADGRVAPFRSGVEFLVRRSGAPVVPIGIDGAHRAFGRGKLWPRPRRIVVRYGEAWPAERVLAPGGIEALRAQVAALARAELRECPPIPGSHDGGSATAPPPTSSSAGGRA